MLAHSKDLAVLWWLKLGIQNLRPQIINHFLKSWLKHKQTQTWFKCKHIWSLIIKIRMRDHTGTSTEIYFMIKASIHWPQSNTHVRAYTHMRKLLGQGWRREEQLYWKKWLPACSQAELSLTFKGITQMKKRTLPERQKLQYSASQFMKKYTLAFDADLVSCLHPWLFQKIWNLG